MKNDINILRELAKEVKEISKKDIQNEKRDLWRKTNSLEKTRPPIYIRDGRWSNEILGKDLKCENDFFRNHEKFLRMMIFQDWLGDDFVIEPWITQNASYILPEKGWWGLEADIEKSGVEGGAFHVNPVIKELDDIKKMIMPTHMVDEEKTKENVEKLQNAIGDILEVNVDRGPFWRMWTGDISTDLGYLRGIEQVMWDIMDNPDWLKTLLVFMRDGILKAHKEAEEKGDWTLTCHQNQAMVYSKELKDPKANSKSVKRNELWGYQAAQELTLISPDQHDEYMLYYQKPILENFGLGAYGCCEDLTRKIDILRKIKNLRRIAVSPFANVESCCEQIGNDYTISYRPSPSETVSKSYSPENIERILKRDSIFLNRNNCIFDITLKDVHTLEKDPKRLKRFVEIARSVFES